MDRYREKTFLTRLTYGLGRKQRPPISPPSKSLGPPVPQTSLIFELPDELILSVLSNISPEPQLTGHRARFRIQYFMEVNDDHYQRARFLLPLSVTCKAMRLRLRPWIWDFIEPSRRRHVMNLAIVDALHADTSLAAGVGFMTMRSLRDVAVPMFINFLESLPNLHTLEIGFVDYYPRPTLLEKAPKGVKLPQIKTLILSPAAHPLLNCCPNVEDVDWVIGDKTVTSDKFLGSLASIRDSKIKRLAIPLVSQGYPSQFWATCPRLTELTILYPHPHPHRYPYIPRSPETIEMGLPPCSVESARSAILELINGCETLQDLSTLQIVHLSLTIPPTTCWCGFKGCGELGPYSEGRKQALREEMKGVKDWTIDYLKRPEVGRRKGGRKETMLRVIELSSVFGRFLRYGDGGLVRFYLGSVKVEYEVWGVESKGP